MSHDLLIERLDQICGKILQDLQDSIQIIREFRAQQEEFWNKLLKLKKEIYEDSESFRK